MIRLRNIQTKKKELQYIGNENITMNKYIQNIIFGSRWILVPFYLGLIVAQVLYAGKFAEAVWHLCRHVKSMDESAIMLAVLTLIDITMVANLIKMIIAGSYQSFVEKVSSDHSERVSSGMLKVKMGSSLIGVSSIHLLQAFINASAYSDRDLIVKGGVHVLFLISTIGLAYIDHLHSAHTSSPEPKPSH